jgi:aryl-alcohol dehydrogenase-like predicted oxidoreductase
MEALNDLVRSGKVRYIGASTMSTWEFQKMNYVAEKNGWAKFISMQNCYNLLYREEEREMIPYCQDAGIGLVSWSPLCGGTLISKNRITRRKVANHTTERSHPEVEGECNDVIIGRVAELAAKYNASNAQISLAWQFTKKYVTSPIIGVTKLSQLQDCLESLSVQLTEEDVAYLEDGYVPKAMFTNPVLEAEKNE